MTDAGVRPDSSRAPLDDLNRAWEQFRLGAVVPCPLDDAPLALAVDSPPGAYRFVCTRCGASSDWFESGPSGLRVRPRRADEP